MLRLPDTGHRLGALPSRTQEGCSRSRSASSVRGASPSPRSALRRWAGIALLAGLGAPLRPGAAAAAAAGLVLSVDFERPLDAAWHERGFPRISRRNTFRVVADATGNHYLRVESDHGSSAMGVTLDLDPQRCPDLRWRWMVTGTIAGADLARREGDDAAAKVCVIFDGPSYWNPADKRALVYVWDHTTPVGTILPNAWLPDTARVVVLRSGDAAVGQWAAERVNLSRDFARAFPSEQPGTIEAVAFLADTDDTGSRTAAGLDDLSIRCVTESADVATESARAADASSTARSRTAPGDQ